MLLKKKDSLKNCIYYGLLTIFVFFLVDWSTIRLLKTGGMNIYYGDIFFFLVLATAAWAFVKNRKEWHWTQPATAWYFLFLTWLALEVVWGWRIFGYRALGESRYVLPFFAFFIPYLLISGERRNDPAAVGDLAKTTTWVAAAAAILFLICSLIYRKPFYFSALNLENQKLWVHKLISSDQSFHIILLAIFIFYLSFFRKKFFSLPKIVFFLLLLITLPVYNRTTSISLFIALLVLLALGKKIREILFACVSLAVIFALMYFVPDIERFYYPVQNLQQVLDKSQQKVPDTSQQKVPDTSQQKVPDTSQQKVPDLNIEPVRRWGTGNLRLYQNKAALRLALKKPFFGQHLGGYFDFYIPENKTKNIYPPHNQYIIILLKTGIIGLILMLIPLLLLLRRLFKFLADERLGKSERSTVWLLLLVLLAQFPYGMGFGFIPLYALYFGMAVIFLEALAKKYPLPALAGRG